MFQIWQVIERSPRHVIVSMWRGDREVRKLAPCEPTSPAQPGHVGVFVVSDLPDGGEGPMFYTTGELTR